MSGYIKICVDNVDPSITSVLNELRDLSRDFPNRELSLAITNIEQGHMWLKRSYETVYNDRSQDDSDN